MSQTFFSKQDPQEKASRLAQLGTSKGLVTIWFKGQKEKLKFNALYYSKERNEIALDSKEQNLAVGDILCTFEIRGMIFFSQVQHSKNYANQIVLHFNGDLFKSERRGSYRLLTYPIYDVWAEFDLEESYVGGGVILDMKTKTSQTGLFKSFLKLVENTNDEESLSSKLRMRVQDLSVTGMCIHISDLEIQYFPKDCLFRNVPIHFQNDIILVPEVRVVYLVNYMAGENKAKTYKVGMHFDNLPINVDDLLGKKINKLLREIDFNKDFENFLK